MEQKDDSRSLPEVIVHTVILGQALALSLAGNSLFCLAFYRNRRLRTITNLYVLSLAVADLMVTIFVFPSIVVASGLRRWPFSYIFCQCTGFLLIFWSKVSLCILALTSINRYFCVVKPERYTALFTKKKTVASIFSVWIFLFILHLIFNVALHVVYKWHPNDLYCRGTYHGTEKVIEISFACLTFLSMSLVLFGYGSVYRVIRQHNNAVVPSLQDATSSQGALRVQEIKASRVLFAAVFSFCVSWIPSGALAVLEFGFEVTIPSVARSIPLLFASISAWINPVIYGVMNRAVRKEFVNVLFCRKEN